MDSYREFEHESLNMFKITNRNILVSDIILDLKFFPIMLQKLIL